MKIVELVALSLTLATTVAMAEGTAKRDSSVKEDNTKVNVRDRAETALTADSQSMSAADTELTRVIRQGVMDKKDLSTYGQNVKIISNNGHVTLKGPVNTASERAAIEEIARRQAGAKNVTNQIEVLKK